MSIKLNKIVVIKYINEKTNLLNELEVSESSVNETKINLIKDENYILNEKFKYEFSFTFKKNSINYANLAYQIVVLLKAGLTITETIESLRESYIKDPLYFKTLDHIWSSLSHGYSLSEAFEKHSCPSVLIACIKSGERTSNLVETLNQYVSYEQIINGFKSKFISALIYPFLVLFFGFFTCLFLIFFVLPKFANLYQSNTNLVAVNKSLLIQISLFLNSNYWFGTAILLIITIFIVILFSIPNKILKINNLLSKFNIYKNYIKDFQLYIIFKTMKLMLSGGYTLIESLEIANNSIKIEFINILINKCITDISLGLPIADAFYNNQLANKIDHKILLVSERNGSFDAAAESVATLHKEFFEKSIQTISRIIEPILIIFVALIIGTLIIMMYSPIFQIIQTV